MFFFSLNFSKKINIYIYIYIYLNNEMIVLQCGNLKNKKEIYKRKKGIFMFLFKFDFGK
jgi:hypothetical protein